MRRLLPPVLFVLLALSLIALWLLHPTATGLMHDAGLPVGDVALAALLGIGLLIGARMQFARADAEIMTFATPRNLVTDGLFRFSRNPMYLGFTVVLLAAALAVNTWCALAAPLAFFLLAQFWYVPAEERAALATFGADYERYRARTRRWV